MKFHSKFQWNFRPISFARWPDYQIHFPPNFDVKIHVGVLVDGLKASEHPRGHCGAHARSIKSLGTWFSWKCPPVPLNTRPFTNRCATAPTFYLCYQELKYAVAPFFMKGITHIQPRIVRARFMIEISWKESNMFRKWLWYYIFPLWREVRLSFLVISSWPWHRKLM